MLCGRPPTQPVVQNSRQVKRYVLAAGPSPPPMEGLWQQWSCPGPRWRRHFFAQTLKLYGSSPVSGHSERREFHRC
jgi:hypothetical protein